MFPFVADSDSELGRTISGKVSRRAGARFSKVLEILLTSS